MLRTYKELQTNPNSMVLPVAIRFCLGSVLRSQQPFTSLRAQLYFVYIKIADRLSRVAVQDARPVTGWSIGNSDGPVAMTFSACRQTVRAHTHARIDSRQWSIFGCKTYGLFWNKGGREAPEKGGNKAKNIHIFLCSCLETDLTNFFVSFYFVVVV